MTTDTEVELVGFTTCDGFPGGNIEYAGDEMVKNGAEVIHLIYLYCDTVLVLSGLYYNCDDIQKCIIICYAATLQKEIIS